MLGRCYGIGGRSVGYQDPLLGRGVHINIVDANSSPANDKKPLTRSQDVGGNLRFAPDNERIVLRDPGAELRRSEAGVDVDLGARSEQEINPFAGDGIGDQDAHGGSRAP